MSFRRLMLPALMLMAFTFALPVHASEDWVVDDFEKAKAMAKEQNKDLLVDFTGSDWCGWCIRLKKEVFTKPEFLAYAKEHFILTRLDYPKKKKQSKDVKSANQKLAQQYGIRGFPTIKLMSANGKPYATTGYKEGGPSKYIEHLTKLRESRPVDASTWLTDVETAKKAAQQQGKDLMVTFVGDTSKKPAQMFWDDLLSKEEFISLATEDFVLLKVTPDHEQATAMMKEYKVARAPGYALVDMEEGKSYYKSSLRRTAPDKFVERLNKYRQKNAESKPIQGWVEDFEAAQKYAAKTRKLLLVNFTGSDWCGYCIRLEGQVFDKEYFKKNAPKKFVMVKLDFPRRTAQDAKTKAQNQALAQKYGIRGYPTIMVMKPDGSVVAQTGYQQMSPEAYLEHLMEISNR